MVNMIKRKGILGVLLLGLLFVMLSGCGSQTETTTAESAEVESTQTESAQEEIAQEESTQAETEAETEAETATTRTITDMSGNTVTIPVEVNKIVVTVCGGVSQEISVLGAADKIVAQPGKCLFSTLYTMFPYFNDVPDVGAFSNANVEEIIKLDPDLVIVGPSGNESIAATGIPTVSVLTGKATLATITKEFTMMGEILGEQEKAADLVDLWNEKLAIFEERSAQIPADEVKNVYYMLGAVTHTNGNGSWGDSFVTVVGAENAAAEIGDTKDVSVEQIISWNPDVIIASANEGSYIPTEDIKNNEQLQDVSAIQNDEIYQCPVGCMWWDRPSPEAILGFMWLAKTIYTDYYSDIDLESEIKDYYQTFYGYSISDEEIEAFLNPIG